MRKQPNLTVNVDVTNNNSNKKEEESDSGLSSPVTPDEDINFAYVFALYRFEANLEGQVTVQRDESLYLLDDSNSYWWLVQLVSQPTMMGYIPADNIETPQERLARLNRHRNVKNLLPDGSEDGEQENNDGNIKDKGMENSRRVGFRDELYTVVHFEQESSEDEEGEEDEDETPQSRENGSFMDMADDDAEGEAEAEESEAGVEDLYYYGEGGEGEEEGEEKSPAFQKNPNYGVSVEDYHQNTSFRAENYPDNYEDEDYFKSYEQESPYNDDSMLSPTAAEHPSAVLLRVYSGNLPIENSFKHIVVTDKTSAESMVRQAVKHFKLENAEKNKYYLTVITPGTKEYRLKDDDHPIAILELIQSHRSNANRVSYRSSAGSINSLIKSLDLEHEEIYDHTNHDNVFRFYLHMETEGGTPNVTGGGVEMLLQNSPGLLSPFHHPPIFIQLMAYVEDEERNINPSTRSPQPLLESNFRRRLAKDPRTGKDVLELIPVDLDLDIKALAKVAVKELRIDTRGMAEEVEIVITHRGEEIVPSSFDRISDYYSKDDNTLFFILRRASPKPKPGVLEEGTGPKSSKRLTAKYNIKKLEQMKRSAGSSEEQNPFITETNFEEHLSAMSGSGSESAKRETFKQRQLIEGVPGQMFDDMEDFYEEYDDYYNEEVPGSGGGSNNQGGISMSATGGTSGGGGGGKKSISDEFIKESERLDTKTYSDSTAPPSVTASVTASASRGDRSSQTPTFEVRGGEPALSLPSSERGLLSPRKQRPDVNTKQVIRTGLFDAGGFSDFLTLTNALFPTDADIEKQASKVAKEILELFEAPNQAICAIEKDLEALISNIENVY